jgi:hypothetical protein
MRCKLDLLFAVVGYSFGLFTDLKEAEGQLKEATIAADHLAEEPSSSQLRRA